MSEVIQDYNLISIKGNASKSEVSIGELKEVFSSNSEPEIPVETTVTSDNITDATNIGKSLIKASTQALARTAIGAGTSNLQLGTTAGTALAGNTALLQLGTTAGTAMAGNKTFSKADVGLSNVDNTTDANKPVSTAQKAALDLKADKTELLKIGTTGTTAAAGNHTHTASSIGIDASIFPPEENITNVEQAISLLLLMVENLQSQIPPTTGEV